MTTFRAAYSCKVIGIIHRVTNSEILFTPMQTADCHIRQIVKSVHFPNSDETSLAPNLSIRYSVLVPVHPRPPAFQVAKWHNFGDFLLRTRQRRCPLSMFLKGHHLQFLEWPYQTLRNTKRPTSTSLIQQVSMSGTSIGFATFLRIATWIWIMNRSLFAFCEPHHPPTFIWYLRIWHHGFANMPLPAVQNAESHQHSIALRHLSTLLEVRSIGLG